MVDKLSPGVSGLEGRRVIVTGAAQGLGQATALWLAGMGAKVIAADIKPCAETVGAAHHGQISEKKVDLGTGEALDAWFADVLTEGPVYGLVNCGAVILRRPLFETTADEIDFQTAVNQSGVFFLACAALRHMIEQKDGRIVLYASVGAFTGGYNGSFPYSMNKAGVIALVKSLSRHGAPHGVTVNAVSPGAADTAMFRQEMTQADIDNFKKMIPMGRAAAPEELAAPTAFLLTDWARFITGTTLHVNGGQVML